MEKAAIAKRNKTGRNKVTVHFRTEVVFHSESCSSFLVSYKRVNILKAVLPQRGNVLQLLQHTEIHPSGSRQKDNQSYKYFLR